jgi:hypothetical protein
MTDEDNVIDVEAVEIEESDNLPAVVKTESTHGAASSIEGRDWSTYSRPERRCTAHSSRTGQPCKNAAILGVCRYHGGAAKQIKQAARTRLENAADLMAKELLGIALTADTDSVKLAAVRDALDRAGLRAPSEVVLSQGEPKPWEEVFDGIGGTPPGESPSVASDYDLAGLGRDVADVEISSPPPQPHTDTQTQPPGHTEPRNQGMNPSDSMGSVECAESAGEQDEASSGHESPREGRARQRDREARAQRVQRHITGEDAMRIAAELKREQLALESPHKGYRRP